jgi:DNA-binding response OmpR family regulator
MKILLIEDEPRLNEFIKKGLEQNGYVVDASTHGSAGLEMVSVNSYDLVLLDVMLPGQSGFEVLENMRRFNIKIPVIIISALSHSQAVIEGLDKGAADYIKKPFDFGELLARIRVVTRKGDAKNYSAYKIGELEINLISRKVTSGIESAALTNREFVLLELLMSNCNRIISKTEIAEKVWEINFDMGSNVIEVHISQLRKKIESGGSSIIQTKVGVGYYIEGELICK